MTLRRFSSPIPTSPTCSTLTSGYDFHGSDGGLVCTTDLLSFEHSLAPSNGGLCFGTQSRIGGNGGGGINHAKDSCAGGGRKARASRKKQNSSQTRRFNHRLSPEGLGDQNDLDNDNGLNARDIGDVERELEALPGPVAEKAVLSSEAVNIVSALSSVARDCLLPLADSEIISSVDAVVQVLQGSTVAAEPLQPEGGRVVLLATLARRCQKAEVIEACVQLNYWLNVLIFSCQMNRCVAPGQMYASSHLILSEK